MRRLRPTPATTRRWPRTGSASRPATRCRNAGSPRCSDAHPAAGREPESPMHGRHRRSQTRRAPRSRLTRKQGPPAVSPERDLTRAWKIRNRGLAVSQKRALGEPGRHEGKRSGLARHPRRDYTAHPILRRDPGPGSCLRCGEQRGTYRRERRQDPAIRPRHRYFEFYRNPGASTVPLLEMDDLDQARPSWPAAAPSYSASRSQTAPGPGSPSGRPTGTSTAWAPAWRSWQARILWSNALDMRSEECGAGGHRIVTR
jgi:hypothetical protein